MHGSDLVVVAALLLAYAAVSRRLGSTVITAPMVFVAGGLIGSAEALGLLELDVDSSSVRAVAEATLTLVLFADASRIDVKTLRREYVVPLRLLAIGLPLTIAAGTLVGAVMLGELLFIEAIILAIVLAPTDAALGQAVVTDPRIPSRIRQGLNIESGLNDGICVPLLLIAIAVAEAEGGAVGTGEAARLVVEEIGYGVLAGVLAGVVVAYIVKLGVQRSLIEAHWLQVVPVAGAALAYGLAVWLGGSGFIAAFVGGMVFGGIRRDAGGEVTELTEEVGNLLGGVTFILFGAVMLAPLLDDLSAAAVAYALLSLTLIRMLPVWLAMLGTGARPPTLAFLGWFGPRGLASIVFAVILIEDADLTHAGVLGEAIVATIGLSVLLHGLSASPLTERYVRWYAASREPATPTLENGQAPDEHAARSRLSGFSRRRADAEAASGDAAR